MTTQGELPCLNCHSEMRGPFVFDHVTGSGGNCLSCHQPHGSNNPNQLLWARVEQLCLSCHSQTGGPSTFGVAAAVLPRPDASPLPQLHDLPRRGPRLQPLAPAAEMSTARGFVGCSSPSRRSPLVGRRAPRRTGDPDRSRGRLSLGRRLGQRADVPDADQRPAGAAPALLELHVRRAARRLPGLLARRRLRHRRGARRPAPPAGRQARSLQARRSRGGETDFYSALPAFANPFLAEGIIPGQQTYNRTRNIYDATLELLPGKMISPILQFTRNTYSGPGHDDVPPRRERVPPRRPGALGRRPLPGRSRLPVRPRPGRRHAGLALLPLEPDAQPRAGGERRERDDADPRRGHHGGRDRIRRREQGQHAGDQCLGHREASSAASSSSAPT